MRHLRVRGHGQPFVHGAALVGLVVAERDPAEIVDRHDPGDRFGHQREHLPQSCVKQKRLVSEHKELIEGPAMMALFWEAMHSASTFTARALAGAVDFRHFKRLLDVGGGSGAYDIELCRYYPHLHATVYDLPFVTEIAAEKIAQAQLSGRIDTAAGDFFADPTFPADHDAVLLSMILHDWDEAKDREILRKCYAALPSGGVVIISELLADDNKTGPVPAALMSLNMLIETEGGRNYTAGEYSAWLDEVGFGDIQTVRFEAAGANGVVLARKP